MAWWSEEPASRDFDVYFSVGLPLETPIDSDAGAPGDDQHSEVTEWSAAVLAAACSVLSRGGRIVTGFDPDVVPLLAAVGLEYSAPRPAELHDERESAPIAVMVDEETRRALRDDESAADRDGGDRGDSGQGLIGFLESAFAVSFVGGADDGDGRGRVPLRLIDGPSDRFALAIWPDENCLVDRDVLTAVERLAIVRPRNRRVDQEWLDPATVLADDLLATAMESFERQRTVDAFPYAFVIHRLIDQWIGPLP